MTKTEAIRKIQRSLALGSQVITPKNRNYEEYAAELSEILINHTITPIKVTIVSACFSEYDFDKYKNSEVWAIARINDSWLLTLETENEFALGFGADAKNIMMHGFSSSDALGEWCA